MVDKATTSSTAADHLLANGGEDDAPRKPSTDVQLANILVLLERAVRSKDTKLLVGRLLRQTASIRTQLQPDVLTAFLEEAFPADHSTRTFLLAQLNKAASGMDLDDTPSTQKVSDRGVLPEVEAYAYLLVVIYLIDAKQLPQAKETASAAVQRVAAFNRRTLDGITSKLYFYFSWTHECTDSLADIRGQLLGLHRTAVLRHDDYGQETLLNLLLRSHLHYSLYDQAEKLRSKAQKSDVWRSSQQLCRYLYYLGRIRAVQLDYTDAKDCLQQAVRKAPAVAHGFRVMVSKWLVVVRLLLGEIPEHSEFQQLGLQKPLLPYFALTQAVRVGDLTAFSNAAEEHDAVFRHDRTHNLITRLRHNVIRTGLRRINMAYSRISLADVATRLGLSSVEDTESILAKAIKDGGIEAFIDHQNGWMASRDRVDVYSTGEPQSAFHARVAFCLDIHNEAVKAMQFEGMESTKKLETAETIRERAMQDEELAKQIQEEEGDDF